MEDFNMISEINIIFDRFTKSMLITCKNGKKDVYIKDNAIKDFWHYNDASLIKKIYGMLNLEIPKLNKKYNYTYLISRFLINGGYETKLNIINSKENTVVNYYNPEYWGKIVEGTINKFPNTVEPLTVLNDLPISCALINKKYAQIFIDKITNEIKEYTERKTNEMKNLISDIETLYGLKEDNDLLSIEKPIKAKVADKKLIEKTAKEKHIELV